ncbi:MAG: stage IV sporulation protein A [Lachnospiraceae bacterium]|nr:stage IV sporulation protein A [Lachnospiraceae bacterium]
MEVQYQVYEDMKMRTNGEMYIGVVGPVRTGKSTFIKRFMNLMVIPEIEDMNSRERAIDELPQSANGKTIMTTEPKFIPKEAIEIKIGNEVSTKIRMIDCVGYMVEGASGALEDEKERLVKTPWFDKEIPFSQAAEIGTQRVIREHSTIGVVITTDGSFGEIARNQYVNSERQAIEELKAIGKPFVVVLNSSRPFAKETQNLVKEMEAEYDNPVISVNCEQLQKTDVEQIFSAVLSTFPIDEVQFKVPKWVGLLPKDHELVSSLVSELSKIIGQLNVIKDLSSEKLLTEDPYIQQIKMDDFDMQTGVVSYQVVIKDEYYYAAISELSGINIHNEREMIAFIKNMAEKKNEYEKMALASQEVHQKGYGVFTPQISEINLEEPQLIKHGNKYGVKIKASTPSIHLIKASIETEIAPIVGSEEQANDLINYINSQGQQGSEGIWNTNIFGKSLQQLVEEGIQAKVNKLSDESQLKLQDTLQKVVNDSNGGLVCIII